MRIDGISKEKQKKIKKPQQLKTPRTICYLEVLLHKKEQIENMTVESQRNNQQYHNEL